MTSQKCGFACLVAIVSLWPIFDQIGFLMQTRVHSQGAISRFIANEEKEIMEFRSATKLSPVIAKVMLVVKKFLFV